MKSLLKNWKGRKSSHIDQILAGNKKIVKCGSWNNNSNNSNLELDFLVIVLCRIISILTVFVNKALLSSKAISLDAPLFVTWYQCVVSATICFTLSMLTKIFPKTFTFPEGSPLNREVAAKVCSSLCSLSIYLYCMIWNCICIWNCNFRCFLCQSCSQEL